MNYPKHYSEFLELIDRKALVDGDFRRALTKGDMNNRRTAIINLIASMSITNEYKKELEEHFKKIKKIYIHTDSPKKLNFVLSHRL